MKPIRFVNTAMVDGLFALRSGERRIQWQAFAVGIALSTFMNSDGECYPSRAALAERCGLKPNKISEAVADLEERGLIVVERGPGRGNRYRLNRSFIGTGPVLNRYRTRP